MLDGCWRATTESSQLTVTSHGLGQGIDLGMRYKKACKGEELSGEQLFSAIQPLILPAPQPLRKHGSDTSYKTEGFNSFWSHLAHAQHVSEGAELRSSLNPGITCKKGPHQDFLKHSEISRDGVIPEPATFSDEKFYVTILHGEKKYGVNVR